ncbi:hypothetical protein, partial [Brevibacterium samyangense]|uniref:hypothetical protein n=1 Tax=Brevibacterium samyangense TaxID=366888 RepID=UPI0031D45845
VDDHGDVLVTAPGVPPHVLIDPDDLDTVQAGRVLDEQTPVASAPSYTLKGDEPVMAVSVIWTRCR